MKSTFCPLSPSGIHRVYYSARNRPSLGLMRECRDCSQTIAFIDNAWQVPPPGEIVVGLMAEFQARMIEGDPDRPGENPRGIFGATTIEVFDVVSSGAAATLLRPSMPGIVS